jgi:hypothetical protein
MASHGITRLLTLNVSDFEGMASVAAVHPRVVLGE